MSPAAKREAPRPLESGDALGAFEAGQPSSASSSFFAPLCLAFVLALRCWSRDVTFHAAPATPPRPSWARLGCANFDGPPPASEFPSLPLTLVADRKSTAQVTMMATKQVFQFTHTFADSTPNSLATIPCGAELDFSWGPMQGSSAEAVPPVYLLVYSEGSTVSPRVL